MAEHEIFLSVPTYGVRYSNVAFETRNNGALLGRLPVSSGDLEWRLPNEMNREAIRSDGKTSRKSWPNVLNGHSNLESSRRTPISKDPIRVLTVLLCTDN